MNYKIKGLDLDGYELKSAQYADDIWVILEPGEKQP